MEEIEITYLSASGNTSISRISYPLYYSYSKIPEISGADIVFKNLGDKYNATVVNGYDKGATNMDRVW